MHKSMGISYTGYLYAPEQFGNVCVYGIPFPLDAPAKQRLGYIRITKGREECIAEIKRLYRASLRKRQRCTIGFFMAGSNREYCFCYGLSAYDDDLPGKYAVYKEFKRSLMKRNCMIEEFQSATLGADYTPEKVEKHYREVDITRPVKIYYIEKKAVKT